MSKFVLDILNINENTISFSGNFRIFSTIEPISNVLSISNIIETLTLNDNNINYISRNFRFSKDGENWSMWYDYSPLDLGILTSLEFNPNDNIYFAFKYSYSDGTHNELLNPITIDSLQLQLNMKVDKFPLKLSQMSANVKCTKETCLELLFDREPKFNLYDVGGLTDFYVSMSYSANILGGLPVLYFSTTPNKSGIDFIFREYSLYDIASRKCIKVIVNKNQFPSSNFMYQNTDMDYHDPFEIHIDKSYFESMFGYKVEPRQKDFLYFPLVNRMYEIQGSPILHRGFMMQPIYWKIQLVKFKPNINYNLDEQNSQFLDNMLLTSESQFGNEAKSQELNSLMNQQYSTTSNVADETRSFMDTSLYVGETDINYNYTRFINYYYDLSKISNSSNLAVIYKDTLKIEDKNDATFVFSFKLMNNISNSIIFVSNDGTNSNLFNIDGVYSVINKTLEFRLNINSNQYTMDLNNINVNTWYTAIVSISPTYNQIGMYLYTYTYDTIDTSNIIEFVLLNKYLLHIPNSLDISINDKSKFALYKNNMYMSNIRIFNVTLEYEKHEYIISQLFIKDESMLRVIDNCRPKIGMPFIMKKY